MTLKMISLILIMMWVSPSVFAAKPSPIKVTGDEAFKTQVKRCLGVLRKQYPEALKFVRKYVGVIAQSSRSGMVAWHHPPMYQMSNKTAFYSLTWCASSIAHDAYHSYLYQKHRPKDGSRTPERHWADDRAERLSINYQSRVAKKIGASEHELTYLNSLDGKHADVNGDGVVTLKDYAERDW